MIVKMTAKNQAQCWNDDLRRLRAGDDIHYSIGQHVGLLIERVMALEAIADRNPEGGNAAGGAVHEGAVAEPIANTSLSPNPEQTEQ